MTEIEIVTRLHKYPFLEQQTYVIRYRQMLFVLGCSCLSNTSGKNLPIQSITIAGMNTVVNESLTNAKTTSQNRGDRELSQQQI